MKYYQPRRLEPKILATLERQKSILLLGPRQTGKTTLLKHACQADMVFNLNLPKQRQQFEREPDSLNAEIEALWIKNNLKKSPLIIIDEIQNVPELMDVVQYIIDNQRAQFILTGSSALKRN